MDGRDSPSVETIRALVRTLLEEHDFAGRDELLAQAVGIEYVDGPLTMMQLRVDHTSPPALGVPSPVPNGPSVIDEVGDTVGMLLLWLDDAGYIDCLEYAWVMDEMPTQLPHPRQLMTWVP